MRNLGRKIIAPWMRGVLAVAALTFALAGCGKPPATTQADSGLPPEAVAVRKAFASANASSRGPVEEVLRIVKSGATNPAAYAEALPQLQKFAAGANLTAEQEQTLEALIQKLKTELAGGAR